MVAIFLKHFLVQIQNYASENYHFSTFPDLSITTYLGIPLN